MGGTSVARYLLGLGSATVALVPIVAAAAALCRRYLPELVGPPAWLGEAVLSFSIVIVVCEALGTVGAFSLVPVVITLAGSGLLIRRFARRGVRHERPSSDAADPDAPDRVGRIGWVSTIATLALVTAEWGSRTADAYRHGMITVDTLWYHMPVAARFAQTGWTARLHFVDAHSLIVFYPANSELLHGLGIVLFGNDSLSPAFNLGWLAVALLAGWCVGRPFGVAPLTVMGVATVVAMPVFAISSPGGGLNDIVGLALLLAAVAIVVTATRNAAESLSTPALVCAALASGIALGTKYTFAPIVVILGVGAALIAPRGERLRRAAVWFPAAALTGGYWYVRNLVAAGNPVPTFHLGIGPFQLPTIPFPGTESLSKYLFDAHIWSAYLLPGLRGAFGPAWWILLVTLGAGIALGAVSRCGRVARMLAAVAAAGFLAYVFAPQVLGQFAGAPSYFAVNLRYAAPALVVGALSLPLAAAGLDRRATYLLLLLYGGTIAAAQFDLGIWRGSTKFFDPATHDRWSSAIGVACGVAVLVAAVASRRYHSRRMRTGDRTSSLARVIAAVLIVVVLGSGGYAVQHDYLQHRYANAFLLPRIYAWAQSTRDSRIAIVGFFLQYPLYGPDSSNFVQYLAVRHKDETSTPIPDCRTWRRRLDAGHYRYVVLTTTGFPFPSNRVPVEQTWTGSDRAAHLLIHEIQSFGQAWLYRIDGRMNPDRCARSAG
jgi:hypothetical protein